MDKTYLIARYLLGLMFVVFGLNGFLGFIPMPDLPDAAKEFMNGLGGSGYFFPMLKVCEILSGAMLLADMFVPLALLILAPIIINIVAFHVMLDPAGGMVGYLALALGIWCAKGYWPYFCGVLTKKAEVTK